MKEILFRGKEIETGKWAYGNYYYEHNRTINPHFITWNGKDALGNFGDRYNPVTNVVVDKETLGQFTGLCDKKGKKVFDEDIVKRNLAYITIIAVVSWNAKYLQYELTCLSGEYKGRKWYLTSNSEDYELLGNIYDNPELLEEKDD